MGQLALPNVPAEGWAIDPYIHSVLDRPGKGMGLPTHNREIVQFGMMTRGVGMTRNGGRCPKMFF